MAQDQNPETTSQFTLTEKIAEAKKLLVPVTVNHSDKVIKIYGRSKRITVKNRRGRKTSKWVRSSYDDFAWKEAALVVLSKDGTITVIKIKRENQTILSLTPGYFVNFEYRPSGITLNGKNTAFTIKSNFWKTLTVIGEKWLETDSEKVLVTKGKKQRWTSKFVAKPVFYVPYSTGLHQPELIKRGHDHYDNRSKNAVNDLDHKSVRSLVFINKKVTDVISQKWIKNLCLIEHTDPADYYAFVEGSWKYNPYERVLVRLAVNGVKSLIVLVNRSKTPSSAWCFTCFRTTSIGLTV